MTAPRTKKLDLSLPADLHAAIIADAETRGVKRSTVVGKILAAHYGIEYRPVPAGRPWPKRKRTPGEKT